MTIGNLSTPPSKFAVDYVAITAALTAEIMKVTGLDQNHVIYEEPETQNQPRGGTQGGDAAYAASLPYMSFKIMTPGFKAGDDDKRNIPDASGNPTNNWNTGGQRKMTVSFNSYGNSHQEAYNFMELWQTALDSEPVQEDLRRAGIAVWLMETVADVSQLLNTGYEGRAHLDVQFGVAANLVQVLGDMGTVTVVGTAQTDSGQDAVSSTTEFD